MTSINTNKKRAILFLSHMKLHGSSIAVLHSFCNRKTTVGGSGVFPRWVRCCYGLSLSYIRTDPVGVILSAVELLGLCHKSTRHSRVESRAEIYRTHPLPPLCLSPEIPSQPPPRRSGASLGVRLAFARSV